MKVNVFRILLFVSTLQAFAQSTSSLKTELESFLSDKKATVGISVKHLENNYTLSINGNSSLPMMSVFKFHIALAVLDRVDNGKLSLSQKIAIKKEELLPGTWSPMRDEHPDGNINLTLDEVLRYTVSHSDNNGCDILLRLLGGTKTVQKFINNQGIKDFTIKVNEQQMQTRANIYLNRTTPLAATALLEKFYTGKILKPETTAYVYKLMAETSRGLTWMKAGLPEGTPLAHRTGTSGTDDNNITAAMNNIGIFTLPNGNHVILSVFVTESSETPDDIAKIMAGISKRTWDFFTKK